MSLGNKSAETATPATNTAGNTDPKYTTNHTLAVRHAIDFGDLIDNSRSEGYEFIPVAKAEQLIRDLGYYAGVRIDSTGNLLVAIIDTLQKGQNAISEVDSAEARVEGFNADIATLEGEKAALKDELETLGKEQSGVLLTTDEKERYEVALSEAIEKLKLIPGQRELIANLTDALETMVGTDESTYRRVVKEE